MLDRWVNWDEIEKVRAALRGVVEKVQREIRFARLGTERERAGRVFVDNDSPMLRRFEDIQPL
jgi:hypothetical protein